MLNKIFNKISSHARPHENPSGRPAEKRSRALKIVHVGGLAEYYYMAVPAARIMEKYPKFILAQPEIFRRPWDSIVMPDEILLPGQRYYVVPRQTVRKLRRRIKKSHVSITRSPMDSNFQIKDSFSDSISKSSIMVKSGTKPKARDRHVRFLDIENKKKESGSGGNMVLCDEKKKGNNNYMKVKDKLANLDVHDKRRRDRLENSWEPSLNVIHEININEY